MLGHGTSAANRPFATGNCGASNYTHQPTLQPPSPPLIGVVFRTCGPPGLAADKFETVGISGKNPQFGAPRGSITEQAYWSFAAGESSWPTGNRCAISQMVVRIGRRPQHSYRIIQATMNGQGGPLMTGSLISHTRRWSRRIATDGGPNRLPRLRKLVLGLLVGAMFTPGCSSVTNVHNLIGRNTAWNDTVLAMKHRSMAAKAWHRRKHAYRGQCYLSDFRKGFEAGYIDVANGSNGCTPATPPREYWSWQFQSAEGQARTAAWMAGYPHGARAAEEEGANHWVQLPLSPELQAQYQQTGMFDHQGAIYPIPSGDEKTLNPLDDDYIPPGVLPPGAEIVPTPQQTTPPDVAPPVPAETP